MIYEDGTWLVNTWEFWTLVIPIASFFITGCISGGIDTKSKHEAIVTGLFLGLIFSFVGGLISIVFILLARTFGFWFIFILSAIIIIGVFSSLLARKFLTERK